MNHDHDPEIVINTRSNIGTTQQEHPSTDTQELEDLQNNLSRLECDIEAFSAALSRLSASRRGAVRRLSGENSGRSSSEQQVVTPEAAHTSSETVNSNTATVRAIHIKLGGPSGLSLEMWWLPSMVALVMVAGAAISLYGMRLQQKVRIAMELACLRSFVCRFTFNFLTQMRKNWPSLYY